jgi:glycosyltransferase involved in cell wall biosynthesis
VPAPAVRVLARPSAPSDPNPYGRLLDEALRGFGVRPVELPSPDARALLAHMRDSDVVHIQWLEPYLAAAGTGARRVARAHVRLIRLLAALERVRRSRIRLVWTVHNLRPHERPMPWNDHVLTRAVLRSADGLVAHSHYAARRVLAELEPQAPVWVAPHGHYIDAYPRQEISREHARRQLGLTTEGTAFLCFGQIRGYKRIPDVIRSFRNLGPDKQLIVVGRPVDAGARDAVVAAAGDDPRVHLVLGDAPAADVPIYHRAADAVVLNYREVFSSGALMLALSQGVPVIAARRSSAAEFLRPGAGRLIDDSEPLADVLAGFRPSDEARQAALSNAREFPWERTAAKVMAAYRGEAPDYTANGTR